MKKYLLIIAIVLISVSALFADYTVTYNVVGFEGEDFTWGAHGFNSMGPHTTVNHITISSSHESWDIDVTVGGFPPPFTAEAWYLTRDETGYTITKFVTGNDIVINIGCDDEIPDNPPMQD